MKDSTSIDILLADDDKDDCMFFQDALEELALATSLTIVHDGEQLMQHLSSTSNLPLVLFLDLNMPRKNGFECLSEIKQHAVFKSLPVIIYSTSYDKDKANQLYNTGANYYICKPSNFEELKTVVKRCITLVRQNDVKPTKENFCINKINTPLK